MLNAKYNIIEFQILSIPYSHQVCISTAYCMLLFEQVFNTVLLLVNYKKLSAKTLRINFGFLKTI